MNGAKSGAPHSDLRVGRREIVIGFAVAASLFALGAVGYIIYERRYRKSDICSSTSEDQIPSLVPMKAASEEHFENSQLQPARNRKKRSLKICRSAADRMKKVTAKKLSSDSGSSSKGNNSLSSKSNDSPS